MLKKYLTDLTKDPSTLGVEFGLTPDYLGTSGSSERRYMRKLRCINQVLGKKLAGGQHGNLLAIVECLERGREALDNFSTLSPMLLAKA